MPGLEAAGMSSSEREFLQLASARGLLWKFLIGFGLVVGLGGIALTIATVIEPDMPGRISGVWMIPIGIFTALYGNLLRGGQEFLRRNGFLDQARELLKRPAS